MTDQKPLNLGAIDRNLYFKLTAEMDEDEKPASHSKSKLTKSQIHKDTAMVVLGRGCGIALIKLRYNNVKFAHKP